MNQTNSANNLKFGDIIKLDFSPTEGHEQRGYRPALVLTNPQEQNQKLNGMVSVAPITKTKKAFPTHVALDNSTKTQGSILIEHHRMVDLHTRGFKYVEELSEEKLKQVKIIIVALYEELLSIEI